MLQACRGRKKCAAGCGGCPDSSQSSRAQVAAAAAAASAAPEDYDGRDIPRSQMTKLNALVGELEGLRRTTPNFHAVVFTQVCTTPLHQRLWAIQKGTQYLSRYGIR